MADSKLYKDDSIESLSPLEFTRLRPGVYCGDTSYSTQLLIEIVSNVIDEFNLGHGNVINIDYLNDGSCRVEDFGQGFPVNVMREDGKSVLQAAFEVLNTSGKFSDDGVYEGTALGLNGIGCKITNFLSHYLDVTTCRNGLCEVVHFEEGVCLSRAEGRMDSKQHIGTIVEWQPNEEFFASPAIEVERIKKLFHVLSCLCPGLTINLTHNGKNKIVFSSKNGLSDLVDDITKDEMIKHRLILKESMDSKNKIDLVLTYTNDYSSKIISYVNTGETDSGPHITKIKTAITREFNKFFKDKKWLKDKDKNFDGTDIQEGLILVFNMTAPGVSYDAQTKSRIVKIDTAPFFPYISDEIKNWLEANQKDAKAIFDKAMGARKAKDAAKRAREASRNSTKSKGKGLKAKMSLSNKFTDCSNKDPKHRNLMICEGLSAASSVIESRNVKTDAVYASRGKILSVLKADLEKVLKNQELNDIIQVVGAGFGNDFDVNKMNFDKIVITADFDSDGQHIELLWTVFFFYYMRDLVLSGKLYRAVTPLYIITTKQDKYYIYTEKELENWKLKHTEKYELQHLKGLGEVSAEVLKEVCFEHQRFKRITVSDIKEAEKILEILEGKEPQSRKQFIYENAKELGFHFV